MKSEVGLHGVLGPGGDERSQRRLERGAARGVAPGGSQRGRLGFDAEPEVDHVEHVLMSADRGGPHRERRRLWHRQHE